MAPRQLRPALWLSLWTLLVWTTRIRNIWTDDALSTVGQVWRTALALAFTAFAAIVIGIWISARKRGEIVASAPSWVRAFAVWTSAVWVVRAAQIALADHDGGFIAVHTALAIASIALAVVADRTAHRSRAAAGTAARPTVTAG